MNDEWRVAFAFDPKRIAVMLVAGSKTGIPKNRFYKALIADAGYGRHLDDLEKQAKAEQAKKQKAAKGKTK